MPLDLYNILVILLLATGAYSVPDKPVQTRPKEGNSLGYIPKVVKPDVAIETPGEKISQLVGDYDRERDEPTLNRTFERYQLQSTDLGVPFQVGERTYILFGDTHGNGPTDGDAIAYTVDTDAEDGLEITFVQNKKGSYKPVTIPGLSQGAFEVPMEGVGVDGKMYIYHTTDHSEQNVMGRSVVARSDNGGQTFTKLYDLSTDNFINVSIVEIASAGWFRSGAGIPQNNESGSGLVIFGSGTYRESDVYLAYQPISGIEDARTIQYFTGIDENDEPLWGSNEQDASPLFEHPCVGELSVSYNTYLNRWIMLYNCSSGPRGLNFIKMRTAEFPWGPWTKSQDLYHPWEDSGYCQYIHKSWQIENCDSLHDAGRENDWGDVYGPYQFEHLATGSNRSTTIYFTMSTWNPYTVVLMKANLKKE